MRKGEISWVKIASKYHCNIYHKHCKKDHLSAETVLGENIYIRLHIDSIKRNPVYKDNKTFLGKMEYFTTIREICKELICEDEYANAIQIYSRCLGEFKNMPKKIRDSLNEIEK
jgi:hypothetical protein